MPFVVGVLRTELNEVLSNPMDEVLIIDLDNNEFIRTPTENPYEDLNLLPPHHIALLKKVLRSGSKTIKKQNKQKEKKLEGDGMEEKKMDYVMKILKQELMDTFVQFFVNILGGYRSFFSANNFDKEKFIESHSAETQPVR
jgi:type III secretory pathway component EscV